MKLNPEPELSHREYFELCLSAHFATVSSFVPTDVDNPIRFRLWSPVLPLADIEAMCDLVLEAHEWDCRAVSTRWVEAPGFRLPVSGHMGEWFSTAVAAYGALVKKNPPRARHVAERILEEVEREAALYLELKKRGDGIALLKASTLIAHNLGDLDRVVDMWRLPDTDPFKRLAYKAGHEDPSRFQRALFEAGSLNKAFMADENHRHFVLRGPKCLRPHPELLLPIGPFFDEWGSRVARHSAMSSEEIGEVAEALVDGWEWFRRKKPEGGARPPVGYGRALSGILESFPGGMTRLSKSLPARIARSLKSGELRNFLSIPRHRFEEQWNRMPFNFLRSYRAY